MYTYHQGSLLMWKALFKAKLRGTALVEPHSSACKLGLLPLDSACKVENFKRRKSRSTLREENHVYTAFLLTMQKEHLT